MLHSRHAESQERGAVHQALQRAEGLYRQQPHIPRQSQADKDHDEGMGLPHVGMHDTKSVDFMRIFSDYHNKEVDDWKVKNLKENWLRTRTKTLAKAG